MGRYCRASKGGRRALVTAILSPCSMSRRIRAVEMALEI